MNTDGPTTNLEFGLAIFQVMSQLLAWLFGLAIILVVVMYVIDRTQTRHAVRRNFPVIGRFRYLFEHLGEFFRQYFFAMDREELPFNRAQRGWIARAAKDIDHTIAFGSTKPITESIPGHKNQIRHLLRLNTRKYSCMGIIHFGKGF